MSPIGRIALAACFTPPIIATGGVILPDLDLKFRKEFHSAYISSSSGGIGETRPMLTQTFSGRYKLGEWGSLGGYARGEPIVETAGVDARVKRRHVGEGAERRSGDNGARFFGRVEERATESR